MKLPSWGTVLGGLAGVVALIPMLVCLCIVCFVDVVAAGMHLAGHAIRSHATQPAINFFIMLPHRMERWMERRGWK